MVEGMTISGLLTMGQSWIVTRLGFVGTGYVIGVEVIGKLLVRLLCIGQTCNWEEEVLIRDFEGGI